MHDYQRSQLPVKCFITEPADLEPRGVVRAGARGLNGRSESSGGSGLVRPVRGVPEPGF